MTLPEDVASVDPVYWAMYNQIKVDSQPFDLRGRKYQQEIMRPVTDDGKTKFREVVRKGTQIGVTMIKVIEASHGGIYKLYPQGIIFFFPSRDSVYKFSQRRFKPFVADNDFIRQHINDTNSTETRRIGGVNVSFEGLGATVRVGGEAKDSASLRSTPADWVIIDERDVVDDDMAAQIDQRLGNSKIARRTDMGSPKIPDMGIDKAYKKSDQRRWQIKCEGCGKYTCAETEFPNCIKLDKEGRGYLACSHCGKEIDPSSEGSQWVADYSDRPVVGYWPSQLLNPNRNLAQVLQVYADPEAFDTTIGHFYNTVLGLGYISAEDRLQESDVYECCGRYPMLTHHQGPCAMGVDVGKTLHAVIGYKKGSDRYELVKIARCPDWDSLSDLVRRFNVKSCVIDAMPEIHKPREFQKQFPFTYLCYYSEHLKGMFSWDDKNRIVKANKTEIFSFSHRITQEPGRLVIPRMCEEVKEFAHEMTCAAKVLEEDSQGGVVYRYRKVGDKEDHYRNAVNYFILASRRTGTPADVVKRPQITEQECEVML